ncbi:BTAD domain-containing putative transcriptional regulator [Glycomyces paridis]|uniref:AfsR/SARP family transcriptional regulator n=1 Tax=Glycomyces paridis TaxID=2126555 RepID=A0A4S8PBM4_9ACTN|nr:BTAD domain-containing putative transcriptional regulator [Glycomyces paridis]THV27121.1 AfsR/SARP family transcriptional regulator [Glycomyces paridis]
MHIGILGSFEVRAEDGTSADVPGARLRALLVALALEAGRVVPRSTLVDWIWGELPPADAANALQRLVSRLRKVLPGVTVEGQAGGYRLQVAPESVDAVRFERLIARAQDDEAGRLPLLREALGLWRGAAMQEIDLPDSAAFDAAVTRLERMRLTAMEARYEAETADGGGAGLVDELTDLVDADPMRERFVAALMRSLAAAGRGSEALLVFERTKEALVDALGADPSPELAALHVALLRGELAPPDAPPKTNLRAELTSFVGREDDLAVVRELVADHRLTTLIGPGGAGKTRLATEAARSLLTGTPDGVWLVELAAIDADADVAQAALAAFGLRDALLGNAAGADPTERLIAAVRDREALLILDNCEHLVESVAVFAERLLGECRRLRVLATSREPLGITGEALWLVDPLELPEDDATPGAADAPAVRLLLDRAGAVRKDLAVDPAALAAMVRVCRELDGMPLAIELAAARLRTMSADQLAGGLHDRFRLLTGGSRTALPRHKTLRAVVDWSWELLSDAERAVLRRLAVFADGASLEAAERVCADQAADEPVRGPGSEGASERGQVHSGFGDDGAVSAEDVLELLTALTDKSLVVTKGHGAPRYRMLGTVKEYAARRLAEAGESDLARRAHLAFFTDLAETAEPLLRRTDQLHWLAVLNGESDNLAAAMRGAIGAGEAADAMRLAASAGYYWWLSGHRAEGVELIMAATELPGEVDGAVQAMVAAMIVTFLTSGRADEHQAEGWIRKANRFGPDGPARYPLLALGAPLQQMLEAPDQILTAWESLLDDTDPWVRAMSRLQLGKMRVLLGLGGSEADAYFEGALAEFRTIGDRFGISFAQSELAERLAVVGDFAEARAHYGQSIAAVAELGATDDVIRLRSRQAQLHWLDGDPDAARAALAEISRLAEGVAWPDSLVELALAKAELAQWQGDAEEAHRQIDAIRSVLGAEAELPHITAVTQHLLGRLTTDLDTARAHHAAACEAAEATGTAPALAQVILGVADFALRSERFEEAAKLLAASTVVRGMEDHSQPDIARIKAAVNERLGDEAFAQATKAGGETPWKDLVAAVLAP